MSGERIQAHSCQRIAEPLERRIHSCGHLDVYYLNCLFDIELTSTFSLASDCCMCKKNGGGAEEALVFHLAGAQWISFRQESSSDGGDGSDGELFRLGRLFRLRNGTAVASSEIAGERATFQKRANNRRQTARQAPRRPAAIEYDASHQRCWRQRNAGHVPVAATPGHHQCGPAVVVGSGAAQARLSAGAPRGPRNFRPPQGRLGPSLRDGGTSLRQRSLASFHLPRRPRRRRPQHRRWGFLPHQVLRYNTQRFAYRLSVTSYSHSYSFPIDDKSKTSDFVI